MEVTQEKDTHADNMGTMGRAVGQISPREPLPALCSAAVDGFGT